MAIEKRLDVPFIAALALREKQIQQNYRPVIAVHKWFARRPGALFRGLLLAEFVEGPLRESYYRGHDLHGLTIADPFMGGGTPLVEANRVGCDILGYDVNPMAYWVVREEIEHLDLEEYVSTAAQLVDSLRKDVGRFYQTTCLSCSSPKADVKYFVWVKCQECQECGQRVDLFPGYLLARDRRHPKNVVICWSCGGLNEVDDLTRMPCCANCDAALRLEGPARRGKCACSHCGHSNPYPRPGAGAPSHRMIALEYNCEHCKPRHKGRFFKKPDDRDRALFRACVEKRERMRFRFLPDPEIQPGDETNRLLRWGYRYYHEMFNARQLVGLEYSARGIRRVDAKRIRRALATNLSDLLRYQNMLCRYDQMALKSLDIFSIHGFPVGLIQCESNLLGIRSTGGANVGSGGWGNIISKYSKAKAYCDHPFEFIGSGSRKRMVPIPGEWIGDKREGASDRSVRISCQDATKARPSPNTLDAVFTDPPYFGNVQYAELMEFCYVWLRQLLADDDAALSSPSVRDPAELTGNLTMNRGLEHFADGLSRVFQRMARAMKPGAPFVFTYHHNRLDAYYPVVMGILDASLDCTTALPCPAEMGGSIHINGTKSSIVDTVFVCRQANGSLPERCPGTLKHVANLVQSDLLGLWEAGYRATEGDINCIINGRLSYTILRQLRDGWVRQAGAAKKLSVIADAFESGIAPDAVTEALDAMGPVEKRRRSSLFDHQDASGSTGAK